MQYYIGIDMGTTNVKAILFQENGTQVICASEPSPVQALAEGQAIYDPEELWALVCRLLSQIVHTLSLDVKLSALNSIAGIAITGMGEAGVPLSKNGKPLYPIIAWYDTRTMPYVDAWRTEFGEEKLLLITGLRNQHIFTANKLQWLRDNEPNVFAQMAMWHCVPDYISFCLTGCSAMDYSLAARTMMMNIETFDWSEEILQYIGIDRKRLPQIVPAGTRVGTLTLEASQACGLPAGIPVFAGGHDHICGALAVGVFEEGSMLDSSGTAEEVLLASSCWKLTQPVGLLGFNVGPHVVKNRYYLSGGIPASGASVDWFRRQFGEGEPGAPLANGLLFLPHLRGSSSPDRSPVSAGAFIGLRDYHTPTDLRQAVYEGVCMEMRLMADSLRKDQELTRVVSIGGGTKNKVWLQTKADVLNHPIEIPKVRESTALGAAMLAAIGAGQYADAESAFAATYQLEETVRPRADYAEQYHAQYQKFKKLYPALFRLYSDLQSC